MADLSQLTRPKVVATIVEIEGETINVEFDRNRVTLRWVADVQRGLRDGDAPTFSRALAEVIHAWDITAAGDDYPPTANNVAELPAALLGELLEAIQNAAAPGAAEGNASGSTSSTDATASANGPANPPTGPSTSPSPTPSASLPSR